MWHLIAETSLAYFHKIQLKMPIENATSASMKGKEIMKWDCYDLVQKSIKKLSLIKRKK